MENSCIISISYFLRGTSFQATVGEASRQTQQTSWQAVKMQHSNSDLSSCEKRARARERERERGPPYCSHFGSRLKPRAVQTRGEPSVSPFSPTSSLLPAGQPNFSLLLRPFLSVLFRRIAEGGVRPLCAVHLAGCPRRVRCRRSSSVTAACLFLREFVTHYLGNIGDTSLHLFPGSDS